MVLLRTQQSENLDLNQSSVMIMNGDLNLCLDSMFCLRIESTLRTQATKRFPYIDDEEFSMEGVIGCRTDIVILAIKASSRTSKPTTPL